MSENRKANPVHRRWAWRYARAVVAGRWLVLAALAGAVFAAVSFLPPLAQTGLGLSGVVGTESKAIRAQVQAVEQFRLPLLTRAAVVQHSPDGLDVYAQARVVLRALAVNKQALQGGSEGSLRLALPVLNRPELVPDGTGRTTTAVTYLFTDPGADFGEQNRAAHEYASTIDRAEDPDHLLGVTGTAPLQIEQAGLVHDNARWVEIGSIVAVALIVGFTFRSVLVPAVTLVTAVVAYVVANRVVAAGVELAGFTAPAQLEPVLVALALGVSTDYTIFLIAGLERRLGAGDDCRTAVRGAVAEYVPIVVVAGFTVAGGVLALIVSRTAIFRAFGPGLAATVLAALVVSIVLVPALLAVLGRWVFWPSRPRQRFIEEQRRDARWGVRLLTRRGGAAVVAGGIIALLVVAALPLRDLRESFSPMTALPHDNAVRVAWEGAAAGFAPGVLSPTEIIVHRQGVADDLSELGALQRGIDHQPGVARVFGPADFTLPAPLRQQVGVFLAPDGNFARFLVVLDADPLGAAAVEHLRHLTERMPGLVAESGLDGGALSYAGDTALGLSLIDSARSDILRVALAVAVVDLLLLAMFLRAWVVPLYLLGVGFLSVAATLGLTTLVFDYATESEGLIFFVPFAAGALLISFGSDYSIFSVGYVRAEARERPLSEAIAVAVPSSRRVIIAAGLALAASFGFVALVPLAQFRELAFALGVGILLDAFVVRSYLVPALIALQGGHRRDSGSEASR
nr:MMPL family transporter [Saccharopolyspora elongata]